MLQRLAYCQLQGHLEMQQLGPAWLCQQGSAHGAWSDCKHDIYSCSKHRSQDRALGMQFVFKLKTINHHNSLSRASKFEHVNNSKTGPNFLRAC